MYKLTVLALVAAVILTQPAPSKSDDIGTNFFLKASKSVPRIGRRSMDYENFFLKASKSVPRIGRKRTPMQMTGGDIIENPVYRSNVIQELEKSNGKFFTVGGQPIWNLEKVYQEYPEMFQGDEPYREVSATDPDSYWQKVKRALELEETRSQPDV